MFVNNKTSLLSKLSSANKKGFSVLSNVEKLSYCLYYLYWPPGGALDNKRRSVDDSHKYL